MKTLSQTFRSIKRPIPNLKLSKSSSSPTKSELKINAQPKSESWSVYLILSTNHPIKTYVGVTTNFPRRLKEHNGELKGGAKASRAGRPWICACIVCGFTNRSEDEPNPGTPEGLDKNMGYIVNGVKLVYLNQNGKLCQREFDAKIKTTIPPRKVKIGHVHYCNTGKQL